MQCIACFLLIVTQEMPKEIYVLFFPLDFSVFREYYIGRTFVLFILLILEMRVTDRVIFHIDCNKFFASVECLHRPEIRECPVAVGGSVEKRHGIVLTANQIAAGYGVKTAEPLWQAVGKCPKLIVVPPNYPLYVRFSNLARKIYSDYTDKVESFGLDECWLDVTDNVSGFEEGAELADRIRLRIKEELGITVSIGVSWNKVFAKLGSDYKKPDAVTVFSRENFREKVFPLPCRDLLYVGPATEKKLRSRGIYTIGEIAAADPDFLCSFLGKNGYMLYAFATGLEDSEVKNIDHQRGIKSVGNSVTAPRDLVTFEDIKLTFTVLSETVARRLRDHGLRANNVGISVRDSKLNTFTRQIALLSPTSSAEVLIKNAMKLFHTDMSEPFRVRSIGVCASDLCSADRSVQFDMFGEVKQSERAERLEKAVDILKYRFGNDCVKRASMLSDIKLTDFDPYEDHRVHPEGWFRL